MTFDLETLFPSERYRILASIVHLIHAHEGIFDEKGHLTHHTYHPLGRMAAPDWYTRTTDQFEIPRPD